MSDAPQISVIMSVYNSADDLHASIPCILEQTFKDFEFIIIDDGSTDTSAQILQDYANKDSRIKILTQNNTGLTKALNTALSHAKGQYIARQDTDDVSYPTRFEKQLEEFKKTPDLVLLGTNADDIYDNGKTELWGYTDDNAIRKSVFVKPPFPHSSAMIKNKAIRDLGGYNESFKTSQDMELWMRLAKYGKIAMLSEPLIQRKIHKNAISRKKRFRQFYDGFQARALHHPQGKGMAFLLTFLYILASYTPNKILKSLKSAS